MLHHYALKLTIPLIGLAPVLGSLASDHGFEGGDITGWGFAITVSWFLFRELQKEKEEAKAERARADEERHEFIEQLEEARDLADKRHVAAIKFTTECTQELRSLRQNLKHCKTCNLSGKPSKPSDEYIDTINNSYEDSTSDTLDLLD